MTWEQKQELEYKARQEKRRERNLQAVQMGREWAVALSVVEGFIEAQRRYCIDKLETGEYNNDFELQELLARLRILRQFELLGANYISSGNIAERELRENGEG